MDISLQDITEEQPDEQPDEQPPVSFDSVHKKRQNKLYNVKIVANVSHEKHFYIVIIV